MYFYPQWTHFRFVVTCVRFYSKNKSSSNLLNILKTMPKEPRHVIAAQKQRIKIKQKSSKYVPGKVHLQILGTGAKGAPRAVYLFSDQSRYLFNCGEGTQRLAHEHKMKLGKLEQIFITQTVWKNIGGLPGTSLTIQDVGVPQITLHGPPGLNEIFLAAQRFIVLKNLKINIADCSKNSFFEDNVMKVKYVSLSKNETTDNDKDIQASVDQAEAATSTRNERKARKRSLSATSNNEIFEDNTDYFAHERKKSKRSRSRKRSRSLSQPPGSGTSANNSVQFDKNTLKEITDNKTSICYICCLQPRPGSLNLEKCVLKGVPPGPLLGRLKNGEDVTLENGDTVKSSDVCDPDDPGPVFLVVDCPSEKYLESLITNTEIRKHQKFAEKDTDVACLVVHFTPSEVTRLPQYQKWIEDFIPSTHHIFINEDNTCMGSIAVHRIQHKLNLLSPNFFPLLNDHDPSHIENLQHIPNKKQKCDSVNEDNLNRVSNDNMVDNNSSRHSRKFGALYSFHLRPKKGPEDISEIKLDPDEYVRETMTEEFVVVHNELKQKLTDAARSLTIKGYPRVLFLGTGSCIPNKTRNTSGILLHTSESCNIVLDCGEGTYGQILRFYGKNDSETVLSNIKAIYISHLHADHHIGLIGLLQGRRRALNKLNMVKDPVYLFAPKQILAWLNFYDRCFENIGEEFILVPNGDLILNQELYPTNDKIELLDRLQLQNINTCIVKHCPNAFGVAVVHKNGYKITYSGDTMPTEELIKLGMFSDVLIHEATMEDDLANEAVVKTHSTTSQAIEVGKLMEAKYTILTHFSQRYAKLPRFNENFSENVGIAFDNMLIKVDELPLLPLLYPALRIMFAEHYEEMEHKAIKRQLKSEKLSALISNDVNMS